MRHITTITSVKKIIFILLLTFIRLFSYSHNPHPKETFLPEIFSGFQFNDHFNNSDEKITKKYADYLGISETEIKRNISLYRYIDRWMGTPYLWGGCTMRGVDCSCFVQNLYDEVFGVNIKRTTFTQFYDKNIAVFKTKGDYKMGDLLFFKTNISRETRNNAITHVGLYLGRGYFVQSSSRGVNIANVNSGYWNKCFVAAGRVKEYYKKIGATITDANTVAIEKPKASFEEKSGSDFDPIPYPEDLEELKSAYAQRLQINPDNINFPEVFEFIDKYRFSPLSIVENCPKTVKMNNCFLLSFYKDVMNIDIDSTNKGIIKSKEVGIVGPTLKKTVCDIVAIKTDKNFTTPDIVGIYLYNDYFLHIHDSMVAITSIRNPVFAEAEIQYYRFYPETIKKSQEYVQMKRKGVVIKYNMLEDWEKPKVVEKGTESLNEDEEIKNPPKEEPEIETASDDEFSKKERKKKLKELNRLKKEKEAEEALKAFEQQQLKDAEEMAKQEEIYNKKKADAARQKKIDEDKAAEEKIAKEKAEQEEAERLKKQQEEEKKQALLEEQKGQEAEEAKQLEIERKKAAKAESKKKKKAKKNEEPVEETQPEEPPKNITIEEVKTDTTVIGKEENVEMESERKKSRAQLKKERNAKKKKEAELAAQKEAEERLASEVEMKSKEQSTVEPSRPDSEIENPTKTKAEIRKEKRKQKKAEKKRRKEEQFAE